MKARYCYWSVATGPEADRMERCVRTARAAGVFKEFHVLTDRPIPECECYDAYDCDRAHGLFKLHYLKAGMSRLNFDHFVWVEPGTVFLRNPDDVLGALGRAPMHVPLEVRLTDLPAGAEWHGMPLDRVRDLMAKLGVTGAPWLGGSGFWIVHREVIETMYELAVGFWHKAKEAGLAADVSAGLAFALQMLTADPDRHRLVNQPRLWAADTTEQFRDSLPNGQPWRWRHPLGVEGEVCPALLQLAASIVTV